jgi:dTDP-4-amino-4,6-dideoxygalactose transaminase
VKDNGVGMGSIIGGMFGLEIGEPTVTSVPFLSFTDMEALLLVNGRSALSILLDTLSPNQVWLPSYLCPVLVTAVGDRAPIRFYSINEQLQIQSHAWIENVQPGDLVLFIDYFGFPTKMSWLKAIAERKAYVVRDASQALLTPAVTQSADFVIYSPRKFIGVPDGGILLFREEDSLLTLQLQPPPTAWWLQTLRASQLRAQFDICDDTRVWYQLFQETEATAPIGPYRISELSQRLLHHNFDYAAIAQRRRQNYLTLLNELPQIALYLHLPPDVVPLGFPIKAAHRDRLRRKLFEHEIYPPLHWPLVETVPFTFSQSHILARQIMTIPCDQRYTNEDMSKIIHIVTGELKS